MAKPEKDLSELVRAALALEEELSSLEGVSRATQKIRLDSEKNIGKAAKELNVALALPERIGAQLGALVQAMQGMQARQEAALTPLAAFATQIQRRMQQLGEHMQAYAALGESTSALTALLTADGAGTTVLEQVKPELTRIADGARALSEAARTDEFPEVSREADALKQRILALRRKLELGSGGATAPN